MQRVEVDARNDETGREGAHVILSIRGLARVDDDVTFFLRPLDAPNSEDGLGALEHELRPTAVRIVDGGVELLVGPDIAEHQALLAGASVEIELPESGHWSEFQWPDVNTRTRPKRAKIVAANRPAASEPPSASETAPAVTAPIAPASTAPLRTEGVRAAIVAPAALPAAASVVAQSAGAQAAPAYRSARNRSPEPSKEEPQPMKSPGSADPTRVDPPRPDAPRAGKVAKSIDDLVEEKSGDAQERVVFYPYARGGKLGPAGVDTFGHRRTASLMPTTRLGAAAVAVAGLLAVQGLVWFGTGGQFGSQPAATSVASSAGTEAAVYELFAAGPVSPRGVQSRGVTAVKALENAQASLMTPGAPRDTEEASYWLRRFITSGGSDERTRRALTQLGTTLADPTSKQPDYAKARSVWELSSAFGDPVAMCFLGTLNENGLGVPPDRVSALQWYERAKQAGGCPAIDDAIARVKK